jgi:hypothetical protein
MPWDWFRLRLIPSLRNRIDLTGLSVLRRLGEHQELPTSGQLIEKQYVLEAQ